MHRALFLVALSFLLAMRRGVPLPAAPPEANSSDETSRRILFMQRRYISYATLRRDLVPCDRPGSSYYSCGTPGVANSYTRGCQVITRCARSD